MNPRTTAIVSTIVAVLLCGCPGLFALFFGGMFAIVGQVPGADIDMFGSSDPTSALGFGIGFICGGLIFILIPIVVGILTFRRARSVQS